MGDAQTARIKYVFLDIVGFTKGRSVEAQSDVIGHQNRIVRDALKTEQIKEEDRILIPTGDGMCIALIEVLRPLDVHILLARAILRGIVEHNGTATDKEQHFEVRIGLNENDDNLVTDINGRKNVAGAGINMAQRVMSKGDAGHVLLGESVHTTVAARKNYMRALRGYDSLTKHGESFRVYQYHEKNVPGLNCEPPSALTKSTRAFPKLRLFDLSRYGNLYMSALDLLWTVATLLDNKAPAEQMFAGFKGAEHHLDEIKLKNKALKERFAQLHQHALQTPVSDWTPDKRRQLAAAVESVARNLGDAIAAIQPGYRPHPKPKSSKV